jgi:hypothetical protein
MPRYENRSGYRGSSASCHEIAEVVIEIDRHDDAAAVVADRPPVRRAAVGAVRVAGAQHRAEVADLSALRARYVAYVKDVATNCFDWKKVGPLVAQWQALIADDVKKDIRKIFSTEAFSKAVTVDGFEPGPQSPPYR